MATDAGIDLGYSDQGTINPSLNVQVRNVDLKDRSQSMINRMKVNGQKIICYFSAGSSENWRSDFWKFPVSVKGNNLDGWAGEKWLDVRQLNILMPIKEARMDVAVSKGCDAVDPDNMDVYANSSGFPIMHSNAFEFRSLFYHALEMQPIAVTW